MTQKGLSASEENEVHTQVYPTGPWQPHPYTRGGRRQKETAVTTEPPATTTASKVQQLSSSDPVFPMGHRLLLFQNPHLQKFLMILHRDEDDDPGKEQITNPPPSLKMKQLRNCAEGSTSLGMTRTDSRFLWSSILDPLCPLH